MTPNWLTLARSFIGLSEITGIKNDPLIIQWAKDIGAPSWYDNDDKPWCALFSNRMLLACGLPMSGAGFDLLRAKSFETWGRALTSPALGAVMVFTRIGGAHVGFYIGESNHAYRVLGGNQGNAVSETWIMKDRLSTIRWPDGVPLPLGGPVLMTAVATATSNNEA